MGRYRLIESAEHGIERVHGYADLEIHHPSHHGHQPGRHYATVDGRREEVLRTPTSSGHLMVSKDFILTDEHGSTRVPVPSPAAGYVGKVDPRNGLVCIYDHKGGELIAQVRHMELHGSSISEGQSVAYGQPLGFQGGYGGGNPHAYGVHTHIDFNTGRLGDFKRYFSDIDQGAIAIGAVALCNGPYTLRNARARRSSRCMALAAATLPQGMTSRSGARSPRSPIWATRARMGGLSTWMGEPASIHSMRFASSRTIIAWQ